MGLSSKKGYEKNNAQLNYSLVYINTLHACHVFLSFTTKHFKLL